MAIRHTRSISGSGDTLPFEELARLVADVHETMETTDHSGAFVEVKQWRSSGDGYGAVEAGFKIEVTW